jgi:hypothetical protein
MKDIVLLIVLLCFVFSQGSIPTPPNYSLYLTRTYSTGDSKGTEQEEYAVALDRTGHRRYEKTRIDEQWTFCDKSGKLGISISNSNRCKHCISATPTSSGQTTDVDCDILYQKKGFHVLIISKKQSLIPPT